jgi:hypothetical protein
MLPYASTLLQKQKNKKKPKSLPKTFFADSEFHKAFSQDRDRNEVQEAASRE